MNPDTLPTLLKLHKGKMWFSLLGQSPFGLASALVRAGCDGTWAPLACQLVVTALLLRICSLLLLHRYSAFPHLPSVLHEKAVDQHNTWKGLDGRLDLPLLPGTPGACNSSGDLGGIRNGLQRLCPSADEQSLALNRKNSCLKKSTTIAVELHGKEEPSCTLG